MSLLIRHPPGDGKKIPLLNVLPFAVPFSITLSPNEKKCPEAPGKYDRSQINIFAWEFQHRQDTDRTKGINVQTKY